MSHAPLKTSRCRSRRIGCALLLAGSAAAAFYVPAAAQQTSLGASQDDSLQLRATTPSTARQTGIRAASDGSTATRAAASQPTASPAYQPVSAGALPQAADAGSRTAAPTSGNLDAGAPLEPAVEAPLPSTGQEAARRSPPRAASATTSDPSQAPGPANERARTVDYADRQPLDPRADRTGAIETPRPPVDDDPFAPVGVPFGTFVLRPSIEQGLTATSNATNGPGGQSGVLSETTLRLNATSDWARHSATVEAHGTFRESLSGEKIDEARGRIDGTLNLDLDREWRAIVKGGYEIAPESASSPVVIEGTASQPARQSLDGSVTLEKDVGKLRFGLTGAVEHDMYSDAKLSNGDVLSQKDRDFTLYTTTLRGGYEISPALTPFAEIEVGRRLYDQSVDDSGYERSANRLGIRAGTELDLGEKLNGEISAGWLSEDPDDDRLTAISGASVNVDLKWSPERGTIIGLSGVTTIEGTTTAGESGSMLHSGKLTAERRIRSDLTANAALGLAWRDYAGSDGHDLIMSAEAGLTWWLNRYLGLTTRARYDTQQSNLPGRDYDSTSVFAGIKVQR